MVDINLDLGESVVPASRVLHGTESWSTTAGGRLRIQTKESQEASIDDVLDEITPAGKKWTISVLVNITETDA